MYRLIALAMPGGSPFVDQMRRAWDDGDAVLPLDLRLPPPALDALLDALAPTLVVDEHGDRHARPASRPVQPGDAVVVATSGTTGEPKGVVLTHDAIAASAEITSRRLTVDPARDHWLACLPLAHIGGLSVITRALHTETPLTVLSSFDAEAVDAVEDATLVSLVRATLHRVDVARFRTVLLGGGPPPPPEERPPNTVATYGSTETGSGIVYDHQPLDGVELRVDEEGQLLVRSPTLLRAYRDGSDPKSAEGWYPTGDAATVSSDQHLTVHGRLDEMIITGGEKVWPAAVETLLRRHPLVSEVLIHGEPNSKWGEQVVATVEPVDAANPPTLEALKHHVRQGLPPYAAPRVLHLTKKLLRTPSGKLRRRNP